MTDGEKRFMLESVADAERTDAAFTKLHKAIYTFLLTVFLAMFATMAVWFFEPLPYRGYTREIVTPEVHPGDYVKVHINVEWTKTCYSRLRRNIVFVDGVLVPYEREIRLNQIGIRDFVISQKIPDDAPVGPAKWVVVTDWFCNPLQYFIPKSIPLDPLEFTITPVEGHANEKQLQKMPSSDSCLGRGICKQP